MFRYVLITFLLTGCITTSDVVIVSDCRVTIDVPLPLLPDMVQELQIDYKK